MNEIEGQIPSMSGLATKSALTAIENKIPDVITEKFSEIAKSVLIINLLTMINILLLQKVISLQQKVLMQD